MFRHGDYKLLIGFPGLYSSWYLPNDTELDTVARQKVLDAVHSAYHPQDADPSHTRLFTLENLDGWDDEPHLYNVKGRRCLWRFNAVWSMYRLTAQIPLTSNTAWYYQDLGIHKY